MYRLPVWFILGKAVEKTCFTTYSWLNEGIWVQLISMYPWFLQWMHECWNWKTFIIDWQLLPSSEADQIAKLQLCCKYLETFTRAKEMETSFAELSIDLLVGMRDVLLIDREVPFCILSYIYSSRSVALGYKINWAVFPQYYQTLFRDGECFLHIVSLLNGTLDERTGELLVLNVLQTLTHLLAGNDASKVCLFIFCYEIGKML